MGLKQTASAFRKKLCIVARRWHYLLLYALSHSDCVWFLFFFCRCRFAFQNPPRKDCPSRRCCRRPVRLHRTAPKLWGKSSWPRQWRTNSGEPCPPVGPEAEWMHHSSLPVEEEVPGCCATLWRCESGLAANVWSHVLKYIQTNLVLANFKGQSVTFPETHTSDIGHWVGFVGFSYEISSCAGDAAAKMTTNLTAQLSNTLLICSSSIYNVVS